MTSTIRTVTVMCVFTLQHLPTSETLSPFIHTCRYIRLDLAASAHSYSYLSSLVAIAGKQLYQEKTKGARVRSKYYRDLLVASSLAEHGGLYLHCVSLLRDKVTASLESYVDCQLTPFLDPVFF